MLATLHTPARHAKGGKGKRHGFYPMLIGACYPMSCPSAGVDIDTAAATPAVRQQDRRRVF